MNNSANSTWLTPNDFSYNGKHYSTVSTQTFGIFYTSAKGLDVKTDKEEKQVEAEKKLHEKKPLLTAVSAGKGIRTTIDLLQTHKKFVFRLLETTNGSYLRSSKSICSK